MPLWIVDTNVVVSGLMSNDPESPTALILDEMLSGAMVFVLSPALLAEYRAVLLRPAITKRHGLSEPEIDQILIELTANAKWSEPEDDGVHTAPDIGDAHLWALLCGYPEAKLVTGDRLLVNNPRPGSRVVLPAEYKNPQEARNLLNQLAKAYAI
ncbi:putative toxin-antitoxin system toxin component, PIN family [Fluviibacter phosphoraccumulans]|nr:putative toxin-antitoxin system toxin component, PIN family [Fluviibacter phosphoraccumulans]